MTVVVQMAGDAEVEHTLRLYRLGMRDPNLGKRFYENLIEEGVNLPGWGDISLDLRKTVQKAGRGVGFWMESGKNLDRDLSKRYATSMHPDIIPCVHCAQPTFGWCNDADGQPNGHWTCDDCSRWASRRTDALFLSELARGK